MNEHSRGEIETSHLLVLQSTAQTTDVQHCPGTVMREESTARRRRLELLRRELSDLKCSPRHLCVWVVQKAKRNNSQTCVVWIAPDCAKTAAHPLSVRSDGMRTLSDGVLGETQQTRRGPDQ